MATLSCVVIGIIWVRHEQKDFLKETLKQKKRYEYIQKDHVKSVVDNAINYINYKKTLTQERLRQNVKKRVIEAHSVAWNIYKNNRGKLKDSEIIKLIKQSLQTVRFFDNRNYYFIDDLKGNSILFPPKPAFEGNNLMFLVNKKGVHPLPEIIKLVKTKGEGFYIYDWVKYTESRIPTDHEFPKITYFKHFKPYNWFIAVGEYLDYVEDDIRIEILNRVSRININSKEFVNVHTHDGKNIVSDGKVHKKRINELKKVDGNGQKFIQKQMNIANNPDGGFVYYEIAESSKDKLRQRVSFAKKTADYKWIISASIKIDEVDLDIQQKRVLLENHEKITILKIVFIIISFWFFAFALAKYVSYKTKSSYKIFSRFFKKGSVEAIKIDEDSLHFSEFSELAHSANIMIEKRHEAELMLQQSEVRFRQLAENIKEVFWIVSPDWREVIYISPGFEDVWGLPCEKLYDNPGLWMDLIVKDDIESVKNYLTGKISGDLSDMVFPEYRIVQPDGSIRWILARGFPVRDESGEIYRIVGIAEDITESKESEEAIQTIVESTAGTTGQDFFDNVVKQLCEWLNSEIAIIGELENGRVNALSFINKGSLIHDFSYGLKGTPCENVINEGFCYYPENIASLFPDDEALVEINANGYIGCQIYNSNGAVIGLLNVLSRNKLLIPKRTEDVLNIIAARISVEMERKKSELQRDIFQSQLQQSQKMKSIGTLAGGIAHDFNNILFPIVGNAEMLLIDVPEESPLRESIDEIYKGSLRAKDLVKQILTFSRQGGKELKIMKLQPVIKEALKLIRSTIPTTINVKQDIEDDCGYIKANETEIHQIIMNLTTNAYHAMEGSGGDLNVYLKEVEIGEQDGILPEVKPGVYACLSVVDTGIGMDKDLIRKIFDPFYTTRELGKGTGMGLSVVYGIVNSIGGSIHVYSEPDKGTKFNVYIPVVDGSEELDRRKEKQLQRGTERILLVDDEESIINMEKRMLELLGYEVTSNTSSIEAFELFRNNPDQFDLVISDMAMPNMAGDKLAEKMIEIRPDIPILICTGFSENMSEKEALIMGIRGFLLKPIVMNDLSQKIREMLDKK
jgi:PAS domain S-box-containing protein